ncbi:hypothetical protein KCM76_21025 [Zooshikella marina]|uniref:hypothetical protein n=1 Tax=Zooshikella ganghwensis TaxID=202772 RepID=UPI0004858664|nr:hypothetical protein [Zooshikella ganghwensis]MBU2708489.1 hypothetical protein [Zooshikella ganghwensis]
MNFYSNAQIIDKLKRLLRIKSDTDLAAYLNVQRQSIYQYKARVNDEQGGNIPSKIISELLAQLDKLLNEQPSSIESIHKLSLKTAKNRSFTLTFTTVKDPSQLVYRDSVIVNFDDSVITSTKIDLFTTHSGSKILNLDNNQIELSATSSKKLLSFLNEINESS